MSEYYMTIHGSGAKNMKLGHTNLKRMGIMYVPLLCDTFHKFTLPLRQLLIQHELLWNKLY
ncbi:hypothetical protein SAMN04488168_103109 [Bacillus sp. 491mf]|uniref:hypothetical protein n=1 Tax=Bacillus sp. 491mf TaxID=1761755 RepID=UPI000555947A|nr:hypothetical protein [Bacillus sp. 491mf]SFC28120.1 hypothetical protein SAMN04488168_103109 [Bacillus sp. 491mf]